MADSYSDTNSIVAIDTPPPTATPPPERAERENKHVATRTLNSLQSEEQLKLLNEIDKVDNRIPEEMLGWRAMGG